MPQRKSLMSLTVEETVGSQLRRSSRIATSSPVPAAGPAAVSLEQPNSPAINTKARRASVSQDIVEKGTKTKAGSNSPTFQDTEAEAPAKRGRRSSVTKTIEEEKEATSSPKSTITRRRLVRRQSTSPTNGPPEKPRTRRASVTANVTPLASIDESKSTKEPPKKTNGATPVRSTTAINTIEESEEDYVSKTSKDKREERNVPKAPEDASLVKEDFENKAEGNINIHEDDSRSSIQSPVGKKAREKESPKTNLTRSSLIGSPLVVLQKEDLKKEKEILKLDNKEEKRTRNKVIKVPIEIEDDSKSMSPLRSSRRLSNSSSSSLLSKEATPVKSPSSLSSTSSFLLSTEVRKSPRLNKTTDEKETAQGVKKQLNSLFNQDDQIEDCMKNRSKEESAKDLLLHTDDKGEKRSIVKNEDVLLDSDSEAYAKKIILRVNAEDSKTDVKKEHLKVTPEDSKADARKGLSGESKTHVKKGDIEDSKGSNEDAMPASSKTDIDTNEETKKDNVSKTLEDKRAETDVPKAPEDASLLKEDIEKKAEENITIYEDDLRSSIEFPVVKVEEKESPKTNSTRSSSIRSPLIVLQKNDLKKEKEKLKLENKEEKRASFSEKGHEVIKVLIENEDNSKSMSPLRSSRRLYKSSSPSLSTVGAQEKSPSSLSNVSSLPSNASSLSLSTEVRKSPRLNKTRCSIESPVVQKGQEKESSKTESTKSSSIGSPLVVLQKEDLKMEKEILKSEDKEDKRASFSKKDNEIIKVPIEIVDNTKSMSPLRSSRRLTNSSSPLLPTEATQGKSPSSLSNTSSLSSNDSSLLLSTEVRKSPRLNKTTAKEETVQVVKKQLISVFDQDREKITKDLLLETDNKGEMKRRIGKNGENVSEDVLKDSDNKAYANIANLIVNAEDSKTDVKKRNLIVTAEDSKADAKNGNTEESKTYVMKGYIDDSKGLNEDKDKRICKNQVSDFSPADKKGMPVKKNQKAVKVSLSSDSILKNEFDMSLDSNSLFLSSQYLAETNGQETLENILVQKEEEMKSVVEKEEIIKGLNEFNISLNPKEDLNKTTGSDSSDKENLQTPKKLSTSLAAIKKYLGEKPKSEVKVFTNNITGTCLKNNLAEETNQIITTSATLKKDLRNEMKIKLKETHEQLAFVLANGIEVENKKDTMVGKPKVKREKNITKRNSESHLDDLLTSLVEEKMMYYVSDEEDDKEKNSFIDDEAMEGDEDTPSEGSNDIIEHGESLHSSDTEEDREDFDDYEDNSFICDDESVELLSGNEYDLEAEAKPKKFRFEDEGGEGKKKRRRIVACSDSEDEDIEEEDFKEENPQFELTEEKSKTPSNQPNPEAEESEEEETEVISIKDSSNSDEEELTIQTAKDTDVHLEHIKNADEETQVSKISVLENITIRANRCDESLNKSHTSDHELNSSSSLRRKTTSISFQNEMDNTIMNEKIKKVVDFICSSVKERRNLSLNVSLDYDQSSNEGGEKNEYAGKKELVKTDVDLQTKRVNSASEDLGTQKVSSGVCLKREKNLLKDMDLKTVGVKLGERKSKKRKHPDAVDFADEDVLYKAKKPKTLKQVEISELKEEPLKKKKKLAGMGDFNVESKKNKSYSGVEDLVEENVYFSKKTILNNEESTLKKIPKTFKKTKSGYKEECSEENDELMQNKSKKTNKLLNVSLDYDKSSNEGSEDEILTDVLYKAKKPKTLKQVEILELMEESLKKNNKLESMEDYNVESKKKKKKSSSGVEDVVEENVYFSKTILNNEESTLKKILKTFKKTKSDNKEKCSDENDEVMQNKSKKTKKLLQEFFTVTDEDEIPAKETSKSKKKSKRHKDEKPKKLKQVEISKLMEEPLKKQKKLESIQNVTVESEKKKKNPSSDVEDIVDENFCSSKKKSSKKTILNNDQSTSKKITKTSNKTKSNYNEECSKENYELKKSKKMKKSLQESFTVTDEDEIPVKKSNKSKTESKWKGETENDEHETKCKSNKNECEVNTREVIKKTKKSVPTPGHDIQDLKKKLKKRKVETIGDECDMEIKKKKRKRLSECESDIDECDIKMKKNKLSECEGENKLEFNFLNPDTFLGVRWDSKELKKMKKKKLSECETENIATELEKSKHLFLKPKVVASTSKVNKLENSPIKKSKQVIKIKPSSSTLKFSSWDIEQIKDTFLENDFKNRRIYSSRVKRLGKSVKAKK